MPVQYSFVAYPNDQLGQGNSAQIAQDGRFVASHAGKYSIIARSGAIQTTLNITVQPRNIRRNLEVVGKGIVPDVKTSDLWVWEGIDGRDYAITGTWGARGEAFLWDVTDPSNIHTIDTVYKLEPGNTFQRFDFVSIGSKKIRGTRVFLPLGARGTPPTHQRSGMRTHTGNQEINFFLLVCPRKHDEADLLSYF